MNNVQIIIIALSMSFCWLNINRWLKFKPFNCMMCMTGWISVFIAIIIHGWYGVLMFPVGCFAGALFETIKYRYL